MTPTLALALRRVAVAAGALLVALVAHACAQGGLPVTGATPLAWAGILSVAAIASPGALGDRCACSR